MGQRLNIEIIQNGKLLASSYYHWSAFTSSSMELTKLILEQIETVQHQDTVIRAVRLLETTGALLTPEEIEKIKQMNAEESFDAAKSRNDGLIAISSEGIEQTRRWEEGRVEIHLDGKFINFDVFWKHSKKTYLDEYERTEEEYQSLPINTYDFSHIPFDQFVSIANEVLEMIENRIYNNRLEDGTVLSFIE